MTFGGTAAASYSVDSATSITATTPAHASGAVDVAVTNSSGTDTKSGGYTYELAAQTLSFTSTAPTDAVVGDTYTPVATATSGLTPALTVDATSSSICSISGGVVTFNAEGSCVIDANQAGNTTYAAATQVQQTVAVGKVAQTLSFTSTAPTDAAVGGTYTPVATATSGLTPTITVDATSSSICSISGGVVTFNAVGSCVIDANQAGNTTYAAATQVQQTVAVGKMAQTLSFTSTAPTDAVVGDTYTPVASSTSGLTPTITVDATSSSICSISGGVVTFNAVGSCVIDANQAGNTTYAAATQVQQTVAVGKVAQTLSFTSTAPTGAMVGGTYTPIASATSGLTPTITVDATSSSICSISGGVVTFNAVGSCVIDANQAGNTTYAAATQVQQTVAVGKAAQTLSFTSTAPTDAAVGGTYTPAATATSGLTPTITVDATSSSICSISGGVVTFNAVGSCVIDANQAGNTTYAAATQVQQTVAVGKVAPAVVLTTSSATPGLASPVTFTATLSGGASPTGSVKFKDGANTLSTRTLSGLTATYTTSSLSAGSHSITAVYLGDANNATASSPIVSVTVGDRPDPSQDPTVRAIVNAQVTTSTRFAQVQMNNTFNRLEQIHNESDGAGGNRGAAGTNGERQASAGRDRPSTEVDGDGHYAGSALAYDNSTPEPTSTSTSTGSDAGQAIGMVIGRLDSAFEQAERQTKLPFHIWSEGSISFGSSEGSNTDDSHFTTSGFTVGIDRRFNDMLSLGIAGGFGSDHTTIGDDGSYLNGTSYSATAYASLKLGAMTYLDLVLGDGNLHLDDQRWSNSGNVMLSGSREGNDLFGSVGLSTARVFDGLKLTGYGRMDIIRVALDGYSETGSDTWALSYDDMNTTTVASVAGLKLSYPIQMDWGILTLGNRLEYRHAFEGGFTQNLGYADLGTFDYSISGTSTTRDSATVGFSIEATMPTGTGLDLEYLLSADKDGVSNQQVNANLTIPF